MDARAIIDGFDSELELERELGVRVVEIDRALLTPPPAAAAEDRAGVPPPPAAEVSRSRIGSNADGGGMPPPPSAPRAAVSGAGSATLDFAFLHDRPLSPGGIEMMAKIVVAMGRTADTAPVVVAPPLPVARAYIVLGALALRKYFPGVRGEPGQWVSTPDGKDILITYSPAFILRFPTVTDAVKKMKRDMWTSLKGVMQRFNGGRNA